MVTRTAVKPGARMAARFACAAGVTGILASPFLFTLYVLLGLQGGNPEDEALIGSTFHAAGSADDLVGSFSTVCMIPVALLLSGWFPDRTVSRTIRMTGVSAMVILVAGGPLLVLGVVAFEVQTPIAMAAYFVLSLWLLLTNRWLRSSGAFPPRLAGFGGFLGAGTLAGFGIVGLGLLLPWMSWPQLVVFGAGILAGLPSFLGVPEWFLLLGRHLGRS